jgi:hypothetical protein
VLLVLHAARIVEPLLLSVATLPFAIPLVQMRARIVEPLLLSVQHPTIANLLAAQVRTLCPIVTHAFTSAEAWRTHDAGDDVLQLLLRVFAVRIVDAARD